MWPPPSPPPGEHEDDEEDEDERKVASAVKDLFSTLDPPQAVSSLAERAASRGKRVMRTLRRSTVGIPELYKQLGEAFIEAQRFEEGISAYASALKEEKDRVKQREVYASLAESTALVAERAPRLRAKAVRVALEASLHATDVLSSTIWTVRELVDAEVLDKDGAWIANEWWPRVRDVAHGADLVQSAVLAGRAALYIGDNVAAMDLFREARELDPTAAQSTAQRTLRGPLIPEALLEVAPAEAHWLLAQMLEIVGYDERALDEIAHALEAGFPPQSDEELRARELGVELLQRADRPSDVAAAMLDLALALIERDRVDEATARLEQATEIAPSSSQTWFLLAEAHRLRSDIPQSPYIDREAVERGRLAAMHGFAVAERVQEAWPYCVLALLDDGCAKTSDDSRPWILDGLLAAEQALAVDARSADASALCARFCRELGLFASARHSVKRAVAAGGGSVLAAIEDVRLAVELHDRDAREKLERHRTALLGLDGGRHLLSGLIDLLDAQPGEALPQLARALKRDPTEPTARLAHALATELTAGPAAAAELYGALADDLSESPHTYRVHRAWAAALGGKPQEGARLFEQLPAATSPDPAQRSAGLAACAAAEGDRKALRRHLQKAVKAVRHRGDASTVALFVRVLEGRAEDAETLGILRKAREAAEAYVRDAPEVDGLLADARREVDAGDDGAPGLLALRARLAARDGDWQVAADLLGRIDRLASDVPALVERRAEALRRCSEEAEASGKVRATEKAQDALAELGLAKSWEKDVAVGQAYKAAGKPDKARGRLVKALDSATRESSEPLALLELADALRALGDSEHAEQAYLTGMTVAEQGTVELARLQLRLGLLEALRDDVRAARQWLLHAVDTMAEARDERAVRLVVDELYRLVDADERRCLGTALRALDEDPQLTRGRRRRLLAARLRRGAQEKRRLPPVAAVTISIDPSHYDGGPGSPLVSRLVDEELPKLRERVAALAGVALPGFRVAPHPQTLADGTDYAVLVREIWLTSGALPPGCVLAREGRRCSELDLEGPQLDLGERIPPAVWLDEASAAVAREAGVELFSPAEALAWHVEVTLRSHLAEFLGLSEIEFDLRTWAGARGKTALDLVDRILPHRGEMIEFARLVHRLAEEQVPIEQREVLLEVFAESREKGLASEARLALARKALMPGLRGRFHRDPVFVDEATEAAARSCLRTIGDTRVLASSREEARVLAARVDALIGDAASSAIALVVSDAELRPFVQRVVETRRLGVPVLATHELELLTGVAGPVATGART
ncbi:MAG TPA: FHIPEP family type III secretion protein [Solirubrobacteraceae bacterium]